MGHVLDRGNVRILKDDHVEMIMGVRGLPFVLDQVCRGDRGRISTTARK
jgi:hypothetical protein